MTAVTESLVDAKDEARQAETRTDITVALLEIEKGRVKQTYWFIGWLTALVASAAGIIIAVLK